MAGNVSTGGILALSGGALLVYSGLTGKSPLDVLRSVLSGQNPGAVTDPTITPADGGGGASGSALPYTATGSGVAEYQAYARSQLSRYGWGDGEMASLITLWNNESGWNPTIPNGAGSGAYGIPQALPASKMASAGADWKTNAHTQIDWGMGYIHDRYGTPSNALSQWQARSPHWY